MFTTVERHVKNVSRLGRLKMEMNRFNNRTIAYEAGKNLILLKLQPFTRKTYLFGLNRANLPDVSNSYVAGVSCVCTLSLASLYYFNNIIQYIIVTRVNWISSCLKGLLTFFRAAEFSGDFFYSRETVENEFPMNLIKGNDQTRKRNLKNTDQTDKLRDYMNRWFFEQYYKSLEKHTVNYGVVTCSDQQYNTSK